MAQDLKQRLQVLEATKRDDVKLFNTWLSELDDALVSGGSIKVPDDLSEFKLPQNEHQHSNTPSLNIDYHQQPQLIDLIENTILSDLKNSGSTITVDKDEVDVLKLASDLIHAQQRSLDELTKLKHQYQ